MSEQCNCQNNPQMRVRDTLKKITTWVCQGCGTERYYDPREKEPLSPQQPAGERDVECSNCNGAGVYLDETGTDHCCEVCEGNGFHPATPDKAEGRVSDGAREWLEDECINAPLGIAKHAREILAFIIARRAVPQATEARVTPALIMDYAKAQRERDEWKAKAATEAERALVEYCVGAVHVDNNICAATLYPLAFAVAAERAGRQQEKGERAQECPICHGTGRREDENGDDHICINCDAKP